MWQWVSMRGGMVGNYLQPNFDAIVTRTGATVILTVAVSAVVADGGGAARSG